MSPAIARSRKQWRRIQRLVEQSFGAGAALAEVASVARPDTILAWYRKLVARKFDGSQAGQGPGRPRIKREVEQLILRMARENGDWGYDRSRARRPISDASPHTSSDQAVRHLCAELNATEILFPGTELRLIYELVST